MDAVSDARRFVCAYAFKEHLRPMRIHKRLEHIVYMQAVRSSVCAYACILEPQHMPL